MTSGTLNLGEGVRFWLFVSQPYRMPRVCGFSSEVNERKRAEPDDEEEQNHEAKAPIIMCRFDGVPSVDEVFDPVHLILSPT